MSLFLNILFVMALAFVGGVLLAEHIVAYIRHQYAQPVTYIGVELMDFPRDRALRLKLRALDKNGKPIAKPLEFDQAPIWAVSPDSPDLAKITIEGNDCVLSGVGLGSVTVGCAFTLKGKTATTKTFDVSIIEGDVFDADIVGTLE